MCALVSVSANFLLENTRKLTAVENLMKTWAVPKFCFLCNQWLKQLCGSKVTLTEYLFHLKLDWTRCLKIHRQEWLWCFAVLSSKAVLQHRFPSPKARGWECSVHVLMMQKIFSIFWEGGFLGYFLESR